MNLSEKKLLIEKLGRFRKAGHSIHDILTASIENGWSGLFEPRAPSNGNRQWAQQPAQQQEHIKSVPTDIAHALADPDEETAERIRRSFFKDRLPA